MAWQDTKRRRTGRWPLLLAGAVLVVMSGAYALDSRLHRRGTWDCEICGLHERRTVLLGLPVCRERGELDPTSATAAFQNWWRKEIHLEHEHLWLPTGCHRIGMSTRALLSHRQIYLLELGDPTAPTSSFRTVALALATAAESDRPELITGLHEVLERNREQLPREPEARIAALRERSPAWAAALGAQRTASGG
jgi:hypothetical protein